MRKEEIITALNKVPNSQYIRIMFDMGAVEGKLFKDKKFGTLLLFADGFESLNLDFLDHKDEIPWIEAISIWKDNEWDQLF